MTDINSILAEFNAVEANLRRLEEMWERMSKAIPDSVYFSGASPEDIAYEEDTRAFRRILEAMPAIDGARLEDCIMSLDEIGQNRLDAAELGEFDCSVRTEQGIYRQGDRLREYRSRYAQQRRVFAREHLRAIVRTIDELLPTITKPRSAPLHRKVSGPKWEQLKESIEQLGVLLGAESKRLGRWSDLHRHLHFGMWGDFRDIAAFDWPEVRQGIEAGLYGKDEPLPVKTKDLAALAAEPSTGPIATKLRWDRLTEEDFERLLYTLVSTTKRYENTDWSMKTKAPDGGRDIATFRVSSDPLSVTRRARVIIQCRHWKSKSISIPDMSLLREQMKLWGNPPVDELIVATSGRFAQDAVKWAEAHNEAREHPFIVLWPESHLEFLLAARPDLMAEFKLR